MKSIMGVDPDWIDVTEAARIAGYEKEYVRSLARDDAIVSQKWGHITMVSKKSLLAYLKEKGRKPIED
jgi:hypothetical protein